MPLFFILPVQIFSQIVISGFIYMLRIIIIGIFIFLIIGIISIFIKYDKNGEDLAGLNLKKPVEEPSVLSINEIEEITAGSNFHFTIRYAVH